MEAALLSVLLKNLASRMLSLVDQKYNLYKGFEGDAKFLTMELAMIHGAIDEGLSAAATTAGNRGSSVLHLSIEEIRDLARDMEDCVDRIVYHETREQQASRIARPLNFARLQLAKEMQRLRKRAEEAKERRERYTVPVVLGQSPPTTLGDGESPQQAELVGIDGPREELLAHLGEAGGEGEKKKTLKVISIVGFRGLGKTALARELYNSDLGQSFSKRAWVSAAHRSPMEVLMDIIRQVSKTTASDASAVDLHQLNAALGDQLTNSRYFIVIDDMQRDLWSTIGSAFPKDGFSSRIVVTTTMQSVAKACRSANSYVYKIRRLDKRQSKTLFLNNACPEEYSDYPQPDSAQILKKCDGQALALVTVGKFVLENMEWPTGANCNNAHNYLRHHLENKSENCEDALQRMRQVLIHHYSMLSDHALRACFLYVGMFPSGYPIRRKRLLRRWSAEGFVEALPSGSTPDPAAENFNNLIDRNIIQPIALSSNEEVKTCQTYGMMREFILLRSISQDFISFCDDGKLQYQHVRRLCLQNNTAVDGGSLDIDLSLVRSLVVFGKAGKTILNFKKYRLLRVLDLEECTDLDDNHLGHVCKLFLLRYLSLGGKVTTLPEEITKLKLLETLDLKKTGVNILSTEVIKLPHLTNLLGKFKLLNKAKRINELQKFLSSVNCRLQTLTGFITDGSEGFPELMGHMKQLRKVKVWCTELSSSSSGFTNLQNAIQNFIHDENSASNDPRSLSLNFDNCPEDFLYKLKAQCYLRSLKLHGKLLKLPQFVVQLRGLQELCISSSPKLSAGLLSALSNLRKLKYLKLIADELDKFIIKDNGLPSLLSLCFVLIRPTFPVMKENALRFLKSLHLLCENLDGLSGININGLKRLEEVILHANVKETTQVAWESAAMEHPNRPKVLVLEKVDLTDGGHEEDESTVALQGQELGNGAQIDELNNATK
ncbi:disease resistance protein RGA4-like [Oryza brachyantha]|uniref:NB-ARC domain-containing protein n=1 Tax=Oryza brachyantha TaxID=4533 RepID=J3N702_ORYBR|nr:disease resistance protein RGA4-like [Oryza brachyantha]